MLPRRRPNFHSLCFSVLIIVIIFFTGSLIRLLFKEDDATGREDTAHYMVYKLPSYIIEEFLENTRSKIHYQLSSYNFSLSGVGGLEDLVMESGGRPLQSIIISTWRSGTTFLGQLINAVPGTYYHYEPLSQYGVTQIRGPPEANQALGIIKNLLKCNYKDVKDYFEFASKNLAVFRHNTRLWEHCKFMKQLCNDANFTSRLCKLFPFQVMKTVRLRLQLVPEILDDKELNVKVILLIRDPRGVIQSRLHRDFCKYAPDCLKPSLVCADMISDYVAAGRILQQYPGRLMILRYEELALKPYVTSHRLMKFLELSARQSINDFLQWHTKVEETEAGMSSTFRVSHDVPFKWKDVLDFNTVHNIQAACKEAMLFWGYNMAENETHMKSKHFNPMGLLPALPTTSQRT